ncbi:MAG: glycosyl hydrolase, partial [Deltaproteobacteria bacterium]
MIAAPLWALLACAGHPPPASTAQPPAASDRASRPEPVATTVPPADPAAGRAELIYFVLVDRFANGDPSNDTASPGPPVDRSDPQGWHGGDLRGVIDHLDHISSLGTTRLWLSPVFRTRTEPIGEWGAYHGYWQWDPTTVEPRFGTRAELVELAEALRSRRMGLLLDLVTNHVGYDAPVLHAHPDWFHDTPSIEDWQDPVQLEQWQVHGLPDIDQDNPEAAAWLTNAALAWQALLHPTGFRVDAVRHVPNEFLARLGARLGAGHPTWWLGEDFQGSPAALADSQRTGGFTHVFDFPLYYAMTEVFCDRASPSRIASVLYQDRLYDRPQGLVTFLDNHDLPRIASRCHEDPGTVRRALLFLLATRGVPALTYGTEVGLTGAREPDNRADMRFDGDIYGSMIRSLMVERTAHPSLRVGRQRVIALGPEHVAIARVHDDDAAVIGVNIGSEPVALPLPPLLADGDPVRRMTVQRESPLVIDAPDPPDPPGAPRELP